RVGELPGLEGSSAIFPFPDGQVVRHARPEPTLRDMLQQFRHLFDHVVYGADSPVVKREAAGDGQKSIPSYTFPETPGANESGRSPDAGVPVVKSIVTVETSADSGQKSSVHLTPRNPQSKRPDRAGAQPSAVDPKSWHQVMQAARQQLEPEGALTGATRELQAGLGAFLEACLEHGIKVGPWRLQHVVGKFPFSEHPTYGVITIAHWVCKDGQPWKVGIG